MAEPEGIQLKITATLADEVTRALELVVGKTDALVDRIKASFTGITIAANDAVRDLRRAGGEATLPESAGASNIAALRQEFTELRTTVAAVLPGIEAIGTQGAGAADKFRARAAELRAEAKAALEEIRNEIAVTVSAQSAIVAPVEAEALALREVTAQASTAQVAIERVATATHVLRQGAADTLELQNALRAAREEANRLGVELDEQRRRLPFGGLNGPTVPRSAQAQASFEQAIGVAIAPGTRARELQQALEATTAEAARLKTELELVRVAADGAAGGATAAVHGVGTAADVAAVQLRSATAAAHGLGLSGADVEALDRVLRAAGVDAERLAAELNKAHAAGTGLGRGGAGIPVSPGGGGGRGGLGGFANVAAFGLPGGAGQIASGAALAGVAGAAAGAVLVGAQAIGHALREVDDETKRLAEDSKQLDLALAQIGTIAGGGADKLQTFRQGVIDISNELGSSPLDVTRALYDAISANVKADGTAINFVRDANKLAVATLSTTRESVDLLTSAINAYGLGTGQAARLNDIFFKTVERGKILLPDIAQDFGRVFPLARQAGVGIEEVAAAVATLSAAGVRPSEAITQVRAGLTALERNADRIDVAFRKNGETFDSTTVKTLGLAGTFQKLRDSVNGDDDALTKILGRIEAVNLLLGITGPNAARFAENLSAIQERGGTDKAVNIINSSDAKQSELALNALHNAAEETFGKARQALVAEFFRTLRKGFDDLGLSKKDLQDFGKIVVTFAREVGKDVGELVGTLVKIPLAIVDVIKAVDTLIGSDKDASEATKFLADRFVDLFKILTGIQPLLDFAEFISGFARGLRAAAPSIRTAATEAFAGIKDAVSALEPLVAGVLATITGDITAFLADIIDKGVKALEVAAKVADALGQSTVAAGLRLGVAAAKAMRDELVAVKVAAETVAGVAGVQVSAALDDAKAHADAFAAAVVHGQTRFAEGFANIKKSTEAFSLDALLEIGIKQVDALALYMHNTLRASIIDSLRRAKLGPVGVSLDFDERDLPELQSKIVAALHEAAPLVTKVSLDIAPERVAAAYKVLSDFTKSAGFLFTEKLSPEVEKALKEVQKYSDAIDKAKVTAARVLAPNLSGEARAQAALALLQAERDKIINELERAGVGENLIAKIGAAYAAASDKVRNDFENEKGDMLQGFRELIAAADATQALSKQAIGNLERDVTSIVLGETSRVAKELGALDDRIDQTIKAIVELRQKRAVEPEVDQSQLDALDALLEKLLKNAPRVRVELETTQAQARAQYLLEQLERIRETASGRLPAAAQGLAQSLARGGAEAIKAGESVRKEALQLGFSAKKAGELADQIRAATTEAVKLGNTKLTLDLALTSNVDIATADLSDQLKSAAKPLLDEFQASVSGVIADGVVTPEEAERVSRDLDKMRVGVEKLRQSLHNTDAAFQKGFGAAIKDKVRDALDSFADGARLADAAFDSFASNAADGLTAVITHTKSAKTAIKDFVRNLVTDIAAAINRIIALKAAAALFGFLFPGATAAAGPSIAAADVPIFPGTTPVITQALGGVLPGEMLAPVHSAVSNFLPTYSYSQGGIASKPQVAIFGDNKQKAEAFVPLPGVNRGIPVEIQSLPSNGPTFIIHYNPVIQALDGASARDVLMRENKTIGQALIEQIQTSYAVRQAVKSAGDPSK